MLPIAPEAHRLIVRLSGRFEVHVMGLARKLADQEGSVNISVEHVKVATESLAQDNAALLRSLSLGESAAYVRRAG